MEWTDKHAPSLSTSLYYMTDHYSVNNYYCKFYSETHFSSERHVILTRIQHLHVTGLQLPEALKHGQQYH